MISKKQKGIMMINKKAAMFGLDARIALAIFAALSVITGAVLYKVRQQIQVTTLHQEFVEIEKAVEAYMLDTGQNIPVGNISEPHILNVNELFESSAIGWRGPYLKNRKPITPTNYIINWPTVFGVTSMGVLKPEGSKVYRFVISGISTKFAKGLDEYIDGAEDGSAGKIRWTPHTDPVRSMVYYNSVAMIQAP